MSEPGRERHQEPERTPAEESHASKAAARRRMQDPQRWVETTVEQAYQRGEFDDLPGYGKPIEGLGAQHDPDWWLKQLVEREQITVLPPALQIRKDDAELDERLDRLPAERDVRRELDDFNDRVAKARIQPLGGPPMITRPRDVEAEVAAWRARREARLASRTMPEEHVTRRRWWRRR